MFTSFVLLGVCHHLSSFIEKFQCAKFQLKVFQFKACQVVNSTGRGPYFGAWVISSGIKEQFNFHWIADFNLVTSSVEAGIRSHFMGDILRPGGLKASFFFSSITIRGPSNALSTGLRAIHTVTYYIQADALSTVALVHTSKKRKVCGVCSQSKISCGKSA